MSGASGSGSAWSIIKDGVETPLSFVGQMRDGVVVPGSLSVHPEPVSAAQFSPADLANLYAWWDASAVAASNGQPISQWLDLSEAGRHLVQATASRQPTYVTDATPTGGPVLRFDGNSDTMKVTTGMFGDQGMTIFVVTSLDDAYGAILLDGVDGSDRVAIGSIYGTDRTGWGLWTPSGYSYASIGRPMPLSVLSVAMTPSTTAELRQNGSLIASVNNAHDRLNGVTVGSRYSVERFMGADIAEIIYYDRRLTAEEIEQTEVYLSEKWLTP